MGIPAEVWHIFLQNNKISTIASGTFSNFTKCYRLNFDNNFLTELRSGMFDGLISLSDLRLEGNSINNIEPGTFLPLQNLADLWLNRNYISELQADMWTGLVSLKRLFLVSNQINVLRADSLVGPVNQDGGTGYGLQSLDWLSLTFNNMTDVEPGAISWLKTITSLSFAGNELSELSGDIWTSLQAVVGLHLDHNQLTIVRNDTFLEVQDIDTIYLHMNNICNIEPGTFSGITFNYLELGWNNLSDLLGDMWDGIKSIRWLSLVHNKLSEIRQGMWGKGFVSLQILGLDGNGITQIHPAAFKNFKALGDLTLMDNFLSEIEADMWKGIKVLKRLDLTNNQITYIPDKSLPKLYRESGLHLERNNLTPLSLSILDPSHYKQIGGHPRKLYLNIRKNLLHCDRKLCWIKEGQEQGWISGWWSPDCANYPGVDWTKVDLDCDDNGSGGSGASGGSEDLGYWRLN